MAKLIIHLGPPKTATTSLQAFMQAYRVGGYCYGGVFQPRYEMPQGLSQIMLDYLRTGNEENRIKATEAIASALQQAEMVFVSEEVFLLHGFRISLEDKLKRLFDLVKNTDHFLVVTVRNPANALPSFYQEIYKSLPAGIKGNFQAFCQSGYAIPYRYNKLFKLLQDTGFGTIRFIEYEKLIQGVYTVGDLLHTPDLTDQLKLDWLNPGRLDAKKKARILQDYSLLEKLVYFLVARFPALVRGWGLGKALLKMGMKFRPNRTEQLQVPDNLLAEYADFRKMYFNA